MLLRFLLAGFAGVVSAQSSGSAAKVSVDGWYECTAVTFAEQLPTNQADAQSLVGAAQCATFKAPLCYDGICEDKSDKQIDIFVKRIKASSFRSAPNIFFMQGGPGAASPAMESAMTNIYSIMNGAVNVYTMDHRGTGRSTKLECVAAQAMTSASPGGTSIDSSEVGSCADEIESKYGSDISSFSVTSAASDLKYFIDNFLSGQKTFVYGVSYGSSLVERLIHLNTTDIAGYILDGISTTSGSDVKNFEYFSKWDTDFDEIGQYFLSFCAQNDADCGSYFKGTTASDALRTLTNALDDGTAKCTSALDKIFARALGYSPGDISPGSVLRQVMGSLLTDSTTRTLIPVLTYRMTRCNTDDLSVINHFLSMLETSLSSTSEDSQFTSDLVYKIIVYSEFWEDPTPSYDTMVSRFLNTTISSGSASAVETYCVFTKSTSSACRAFSDYASYDASPLVYKKDKYWNKAASPPSDVSVLLMSSKMDPQTPHKYAEYLNKAINTDNKQLITFEQATHGTLWSTPLSDSSRDPTCGMQIVASYLSNGGNLARMDKSCVAKMPPVSFEVDPRVVSLYLNATSAYDGSFTGSQAIKADGSSPSSSTSSSSSSSGTSYKTVFIVFAILFALAAVAAVVFIVKWRQAKKTNPKDVQVYEASNA